MDVVILREKVGHAPFRAFTLTMNDGREFYVRHPELIIVAARHIYVIDDKTQRGIYIEPALVALMQSDDEQTSSDQ